jgi:hypothetical protein
MRPCTSIQWLSELVAKISNPAEVTNKLGLSPIQVRIALSNGAQIVWFGKSRYGSSQLSQDTCGFHSKKA